MIVCQTSSAMAIMLGKYSAVVACCPHQMISRMRDISAATGLDWMTIYCCPRFKVQLYVAGSELFGGLVLTIG